MGPKSTDPRWLLIIQIVNSLFKNLGRDKRIIKEQKAYDNENDIVKRKAGQNYDAGHILGLYLIVPLYWIIKMITCSVLTGVPSWEL